MRKARFRELGVSEEAKEISITAAVRSVRFLYGNSAYSFRRIFLSFRLPFGTTSNGIGAEYEDLQQR